MVVVLDPTTDEKIFYPRNRHRCADPGRALGACRNHRPVRLAARPEPNTQMILIVLNEGCYLPRVKPNEIISLAHEVQDAIPRGCSRRPCSEAGAASAAASFATRFD